VTSNSLQPPSTVAELRDFLDGQGLSPERLAERTGVSNMTWRRLLARDGATPIPEKYRAVLMTFVEVRAPALDPQELAVSGLGGSEQAVLRTIAQDGAAAKAPERVLAELDSKRASLRGIPARLSSLVERLVELLPRATVASRALFVGALLYFINPFDLVADALIGIGLLDDVGVLAIVVRHLKSKRPSKA
jgi:uncharacterized membrane protein YkvA (DUF1232 family)